MMSESLKSDIGSNSSSGEWDGLGKVNFNPSLQHGREKQNTQNTQAILSNQEKLEERALQTAAAEAAVRLAYRNNSNNTGIDAEKSQSDGREPYVVAKENREKYGANISVSAANDGYIKELVALKSRFEKVRRAEEKEANMPLLERQKSFKKRSKEGIVWSDEDKKHLLEMEKMDAHQKEDYGRKKHQAYMEIQEIKTQHPIKFAMLARKRHLSIPKQWNDKNYSLAALQSINDAMASLNKK